MTVQQKAATNWTVDTSLSSVRSHHRIVSSRRPEAALASLTPWPGGREGKKAAPATQHVGTTTYGRARKNCPEHVAPVMSRRVQCNTPSDRWSAGGGGIGIEGTVGLTWPTWRRPRCSPADTKQHCNRVRMSPRRLQDSCRRQPSSCTPRRAPHQPFSSSTDISPC